MKPTESLLHRAKRTAARIALYTSLVITTLLAVVFVGGLRSLDTDGAVDMGWRQSPYRTMEEVLRLQDYIRIDTTPHTGSELAGAHYLASILEREGIPTEVIDMGGRKANLIAVLGGASPEPLILHNHIDVDPILEPENWTFPPFSGHIEAPWIYGRGAFDMKSVAIAQLTALVKLKRAGILPTRTVIFLATSGEETGSREGTAWLLRERAALLASSWGALTEGGVVEARNLEDVKYWGTETAQKRFVQLLACSPSKERLETLRADVRERGQPATELRLTPAVADFLAAYAPSRDLPLHRELLSEPDSFLRDRERFERLAPYQQGLFRDEISAFPVEAAAEGDGYLVRITLGLLPDSDPDRALAFLLPGWLTHGVKLIRLPDDGPATVSPTDHPIFAAVTAAIEARYGAVTTGPYFQGRSTNDSRLFRRYGIPSYGFSPFMAFSTDTIGIGGNNEGIALPAFLGGVELYQDLLRRLVVDPS